MPFDLILGYGGEGAGMVADAILAAVYSVIVCEYHVLNSQARGNSGYLVAFGVRWRRCIYGLVEGERPPEGTCARHHGQKPLLIACSPRIEEAFAARYGPALILSITTTKKPRSEQSIIACYDELTRVSTGLGRSIFILPRSGA